jgi:hypothetical protein
MNQSESNFIFNTHIDLLYIAKKRATQITLSPMLIMEYQTMATKFYRKGHTIRLLGVVLLLILTACNGADTSNSAKKIVTEEANDQDTEPKEIPPFAGTEEQTEVSDKDIFPQQSCGDELPENLSNNQIEFFPVFVDFSEQALQVAKSNYCQDSFSKIDKITGEKVVQVASFDSSTNAKEFVKLIKKDFPDSRVGAPIAINSSSNKDTELSQVDPKLSQDQKDFLKQTSQYLPGDRDLEPDVIVPFYIPSGFEIISVGNAAFEEGDYEIFYQDQNNRCFAISGYYAPFAEPQTTNPVRVESKVFGTIYLNYIEFDAYLQGAEIRAGIRSYPAEDRGDGGWYYALASPPAGASCSSISISEAVKVMESMDYLFPKKGNWGFLSEYRPLSTE